MLYARVACFPRPAIDHQLHDNWGRELLSALCAPGSSVRNCFYHCDCSRESLSEGYRLRPKSVPATCGILSEASDVPVRLPPQPRHCDRCCEFHSKPFRQESPERLEVGEAVILKPGGSDAKSESWGLEDLFERPQISRQTRMPNLMERKSTRRVENGAAPPTSVSNKSPNLAINPIALSMRKS